MLIFRFVVAYTMASLMLISVTHIWGKHEGTYWYEEYTGKKEGEQSPVPP